MDIPTLSNPIWKDIVKNKVNFNFEFLAVKILLARLKLTVKYDPSPETIENCAAELRNLFVKTGRLPSVKKDLKKIFGDDFNYEPSTIQL